LHRFEDQRRVGRGILGLKLRQLHEVARISDNGRELFKSLKLVHSVIMKA
jgi:hypothetical protein